MRLPSLFSGLFILAIAIGTHHLLLFFGICISVVLTYFYIRAYYKNKTAPRSKQWKTTPHDTRLIVGDIGKENVGFSREVYSDNTKRK